MRGIEHPRAPWATLAEPPPGSKRLRRAGC
jgi:hypothetical protein